MAEIVMFSSLVVWFFHFYEKKPNIFLVLSNTFTRAAEQDTLNICSAALVLNFQWYQDRIDACSSIKLTFAPVI